MLITVFSFDRNPNFVEMRQMEQSDFEKEFNNVKFYRDTDEFWDISCGCYAFANPYKANEFLLRNHAYRDMDADAWMRLMNNLYAGYKNE